jgi:acylphosphatase
MLKQVHLFIKGDVVGVGFRAWAKIQAKTIGVSGWVRNVYDKPEIFGIGGGVEALIQAEEERVNRMVTILKNGPPVCRVDDVEVYWQDPKEIFEDFIIKK